MDQELYKKNRQNVFADAWVNGYHIEKENDKHKKQQPS